MEKVRVQVRIPGVLYVKLLETLDIYKLEEKDYIECLCILEALDVMQPDILLEAENIIKSIIPNFSDIQVNKIIIDPEVIKEDERIKINIYLSSYIIDKLKSKAEKHSTYHSISFNQLIVYAIARDVLEDTCYRTFRFMLDKWFIEDLIERSVLDLPNLREHERTHRAEYQTVNS